MGWLANWLERRRRQRCPHAQMTCAVEVNEGSLLDQHGWCLAKYGCPDCGWSRWLIEPKPKERLLH